MTDQKCEKLITVKNDIDKCRSYYVKISNGDHSCIKETLDFINEKYEELYVNDLDIALAMNIHESKGRKDSCSISNVLKSLRCINDLLNAKFEKEILKK